MHWWIIALLLCIWRNKCQREKLYSLMAAGRKDFLWCSVAQRQLHSISSWSGCEELSNIVLNLDTILHSDTTVKKSISTPLILLVLQISLLSMLAFSALSLLLHRATTQRIVLTTTGWQHPTEAKIPHPPSEGETALAFLADGTGVSCSVHDQFFGLCSVKQQIVLHTSRYKVVHYGSVLNLDTVWFMQLQQSHQKTSEVSMCLCSSWSPGCRLRWQ